MTEITAPKSPVTAEQFADEIREQLKYTQNVTTEQATPADVYVAASKAVRNHLADSWFKTQADTVNGNTKAVGYLSAEFLMGKQLRNALLNAGLTEQFDKAVEALGFKVQDVVDAEYEPGLGNGGLGRLAACFIDSLASLGVPAFGYGIQYKYGIFKQEFDKDGKQVETPDYWLANEEPWGHIDYNRDQKVSFGGKVVENADGTKTLAARMVRARRAGGLPGPRLQVRPREHPAPVERQELRRVRSARLQPLRVHGSRDPAGQGREHLQDSLPGRLHQGRQGTAP